jgi:predicted RNA-binding protein with RPS1 domain
MVLDIDEDRRRISLGMKQCKSNPWEEFAATHNKNDRVVGVIKSITDFGIFVGLDGGIDGLVHLSDLSWDIAGEEAVRNYKKGDELESVVLAVDAERERISLGVKQMAQDPFSGYLAANAKGAVVTGLIVAVDAKSATIGSQTTNRCNIDDHARVLLECGLVRSLCPLQWCLQVDLKSLVVTTFIDTHCWSVVRVGCGVVDQNVKAPELCNGFANNISSGSWVSNIGRTNSNFAFNTFHC